MGLYALNAGADYAHAGQDIQRTNVEEMPRAICKLNNKVCSVLTMHISRCRTGDSHKIFSTPRFYFILARPHIA